MRRSGIGTSSRVPQVLPSTVLPERVAEQLGIDEIGGSPEDYETHERACREEFGDEEFDSIDAPDETPEIEVTRVADFRSTGAVTDAVEVRAAGGDEPGYILRFDGDWKVVSIVR